MTAYNNPAFRALINEMIEELKKEQRFDIGDIMRHKDGRIVEVVAGQYWGTYGLSNHWTYREILAGGNWGPEEHDYGYVLIEKLAHTKMERV